MKKVLLLLVGLFALSAFAASPAAPSYVGSWLYKSNTAYQTLDSLKTVSDSMVIFSNYSFDNRGQYILSFGATTAASDSVKFQVALDEYDYSGRFIGRVIIDSVATKAAKQILLPVNESVEIGSATCKILANTGCAAKQKITNVSLIKRECISITKN